MKLNIFSIPSAEVDNLKTKLRSSRMDVIKEVDQDGWHGTFYYSSNPGPSSIPWVETYRSFFDEIGIPTNTNYYATYVFENNNTCYALCYGKSHFYLKPHCDHDFGIEVAKRICDQNDIKQTASKRFQGKKKKDIKSYASNTRLDIESGESVEYLQAKTIETYHEIFGKSGKFGSSAQVNPDITPSEIGIFLSRLVAEMARPALFKVPRTTIVSEPEEISRYDQLLINELLSGVGATDFTHNSYDLYGIDFVFSNDGNFKLWCPKHQDIEVDELTVKDLKDYISNNSIPAEDILGIKITHQQENRPKYTQEIKQAIDYIADGEKVILSNGKWMRFNQDYLEFLDDYIKTIKVEEPEAELADIQVNEPEFNVSPEVRAAGYETADKNFDIFRTRSNTPIEAWDLKKGKTVYAVKFGTAQKLHYVCDQAVAVLELIRNRAEVSEIPEFDEYCLWFGYRAKDRLVKLSDSGSIILKQKIELWARRSRDLGIEPVIKISRKLKRGVEI